MGLIGRFDFDSDFTRFFLGAVILLMLFSVLLTWVSPQGRSKRRGGGKVDDRVVSYDGDLID